MLEEGGVTGDLTIHGLLAVEQLKVMTLSELFLVSVESKVVRWSFYFGMTGKCHLRISPLQLFLLFLRLRELLLPLHGFEIVDKVCGIWEFGY